MSYRRVGMTVDAPVETGRTRLLVEGLEDLIFDLGIGSSLVQRSRVRGGDFGAPRAARKRSELDRIREDKAHEVRLQRVAVHVELRDDRARAVQALDALERDVLALRELHDVLR